MTCPRCGGARVCMKYGEKVLLVCDPCGTAVAAPMDWDPVVRKSRNTQLPECEEDVQASIITWARLNGFTVYQTSRRGIRTRCGECGHTFTAFGGDGVDKGLPDLIMRHKSWPPGVLRAVEVKGSKTAVSPEQAEAVGRGDYVIVRSLEEFEEVVRGWG